MLLLDPDTFSWPQLWTVSRVGKASATVIAHYGGFWSEAKLRSAELPKGWRIVDNKSLAALASTEVASAA